MHQMHLLQTIETRSVEVFQAFIESGWNVNEPLEGL